MSASAMHAYANRDLPSEDLDEIEALNGPRGPVDPNQVPMPEFSQAAPASSPSELPAASAAAPSGPLAPWGYNYVPEEPGPVPLKGFPSIDLVGTLIPKAAPQGPPSHIPGPPSGAPPVPARVQAENLRYQAAALERQADREILAMGLQGTGDGGPRPNHTPDVLGPRGAPGGPQADGGVAATGGPQANGGADAAGGLQADDSSTDVDLPSQRPPVDDVFARCADDRVFRRTGGGSWASGANQQSVRGPPQPHGPGTAHLDGPGSDPNPWAHYPPGSQTQSQRASQQSESQSQRWTSTSEHWGKTWDWAKYKTTGTMQYLKSMGPLAIEHPHYEVLMWKKLVLIKRALEEDWWRLQSGNDEWTSEYWYQLMLMMDLDRKSMKELFLLSQSGLVGRCAANRILWVLLTQEGTSEDQHDSSHMVTNMVRGARKTFDQPPQDRRTGGKIKGWVWASMRRPQEKYAGFSPLAVPTGNVAWQPRKTESGYVVDPPNYFEIIGR